MREHNFDWFSLIWASIIRLLLARSHWKLGDWRAFTAQELMEDICTCNVLKFTADFAVPIINRDLKIFDECPGTKRVWLVLERELFKWTKERARERIGNYMERRYLFTLQLVVGRCRRPAGWCCSLSVSEICIRLFPPLFCWTSTNTNSF